MTTDVPPPGSVFGTGFEGESRAFLQERLRSSLAAVSLVLIVAMVAMIAARTLAGMSFGDGLQEFLSHPTSAGILPLSALGGLAWSLLAARRATTTLLVVIDGLFLHGAFALAIVPYALDYESPSPGHAVALGALAVILLFRATFLPSTGRRTLVFSLTAPLAVLSIQLYHGASYGSRGVPHSERYFAELLVLNQFILWAAVYAAVRASQVNFALRERAYEAARLGPYQLGRRIGAGSMGEVYEATHAMLKRPTAIKLLRPEITGERTLKRFEQEVQQASRLTHPNAVSIYDYGRTGAGVFYYAMELLDGETLRQVVERDGPFSAERTIRVLAQACGALEEAHRKGLVHRDIKPDNLMLCDQGGERDVLKVLDFGLLKDLGAADSQLSLDGVVIGSPETMAPELLAGDARPAADLYSLAAVGCYLLTGEPVFDAHSAGEFLQAHQFEEPIPPSRRNPSVPRALETVLLRNLAKAPGDRDRSSADLRRALLECSETPPAKQRR